MTESQMTLVDWLDDLCVRFIINLPPEELTSTERICFQIEEAQWFYEDFIRPLDPTLPSMNLKKFCLLIFQHCPLFSNFTEQHRMQAYSEFLAYKTRVPVRGAILLNEEMDQAVLVKGWKKGAKWSFPRGKINQNEPNLDCAIREVYEETGYDIREAGLDKSGREIKYISIPMREQDIGLFVFRGVPMDTHFEARTRKEISDIQWYKLSELPTLKRKKQIQQGNGEDLLKDNMFYMVAPFLGPLKSWIKQQRKLDREQAEMEGLAAPVVAPAVTDEQDVHTGDLTADEAPSESQPEDPVIQQLISNLRQTKISETLPEVTAGPDPAAHLKHLLRVGQGPAAPAPVEAPASVPAPAAAPVIREPETDPIIAMLRGSSVSIQKPTPPRTPFEQIMQPPAQPQSPHYHHQRPPHLNNMPPPPPFPFSPQHTAHFQGPPQAQPRHLNQNGFHQIPQQPMGPPRQPMGPPQQSPVGHPQQSMGPHAPVRTPYFGAPSQNIHQSLGQEPIRPYERTGDPQYDQSPQLPIHRRIPAASELPPPNVTAHSLSLLNTFKSGIKPTPEPVVSPPSYPPQASNQVPMVQPTQSLDRPIEPFQSPSTGPEQYVLTPPPAAFGSPSPATQTAAPKPRSAHQDSLLNLFRSPSANIATPPNPAKATLAPEPVELSAHPTPGRPAQAVPAAGFSAAEISSKLPPLDANTGKPILTSATITGPLNAPDFETVKHQTRGGEVNGHGPNRGSGPNRGNGPGRWASPKPEKDKKPFVPSQVLVNPKHVRQQSPAQGGRKKREMVQTPSKPTPQAPSTPVFQILKRPQQPEGTTTASPMPMPVSEPRPVQAAPQQAVNIPFDRRESLPTEQRNALLSLFSKQTPIKAPNSPLAKNLTSGLMSPVSPLPAGLSQQDSPAGLASRSRISSFGDGVIPSNMLPSTPTIHAQRNSVAEEAYASGVDGAKLERTASATGRTPVTPVDKQFLLGFLEGVVRKG
ncbi:hypothetical protein GQ43DRAFT_478455 [Delitschia confertaspora ATCC 74209]|uniref:Nudix hydrolase domain-containing protein n=1 Tax=Delitschia confertaspora ATCC 74209 TaxID=1513339 RepID=A0A9P4JR15_9PLEO|nr:hypothetical protein GQ43DRAFT_478455 [Delitschia confertaspora ATCC 74209]